MLKFQHISTTQNILSSTGAKCGPERARRRCSRQEGFSETSQNTYFERILSAARRRQQTLGADLVLAEECYLLIHQRHRLSCWFWIVYCFVQSCPKTQKPKKGVTLLQISLRISRAHCLMTFSTSNPFCRRPEAFLPLLRPDDGRLTKLQILASHRWSVRPWPKIAVP